MRTAITISFVMAAVQAAAAEELEPQPCLTGTHLSATVSSISLRNQSFQIAESTKYFSLSGLERVQLSDTFKIGAQISVFGSDRTPDRYGLIHVQAVQHGSNAWIQGNLLKSGKAHLNGSSQNLPPKCLAAMRTAERKAISSKSGIWANEDALFKADQPDKLSGKTGHFVIVEGKVLSIGDRKRRLYLNFGQNWSQDFTLSVVKKGKGEFKGSLNLLTGLKGKTVRVRGVLEQRQGPLIRLFDAGQIELLSK